MTRNNCLPLLLRCHPRFPHTCSELKGTTATGKTIDPQLCSNQSFWEHKTCDNPNFRRCTGATPGQCEYLPKQDFACKDGSSKIEPAEDGEWKRKDGRWKWKVSGVEDCGEDLMCKARDGKWAGENICLKKKFLCDNYIQCEDGKDEEHCEGEYLRKRIFPRDYRYVCRSLSLNISRENETGKFFPVRAIRCHHPVTTALSSSLRYTPVIIMVINLIIRCDQVVQCPSGEDEEGCVIPDTARHIGSLCLLILSPSLLATKFISFKFGKNQHNHQHSRHSSPVDDHHLLLDADSHQNLRRWFS